MSLWNSLLSRLRVRADATPAPDDDFWYGPAQGSTASGARVTPDTALQLAAVFGCVRVISETVASLPLLMYRWRSDGGKERAADHPLYDILHDRPNAWQTSFEFREMMQAHLELRGNAYAQIVPGRRGAVDQLIPLHPDRVTPRSAPGNRIIYKVNWNDGTSSDLLQEEIFHLRGFSLDGIVGLSPIALEREVVGLGLTAQEYGARFFANDSTPGGVLEHPEALDQDAADRLKKSWHEKQGGANRHKVAVLDSGMKFHQIGLTNRDAQFLETRKYNAEDIARIYRVQPHKIGILDRATFSNIEHLAIEWVTDSVVPRLRRWEQRISFDLILAPQTYFAEFLVDGLLRGDIKSRYDAYAIARQWGWMNGNEIRASENMNPFEGGETYWAPFNMTPAEQLGKAPAGTAAPPPTSAVGAQVGMILDAAAERVVRKEVGTLRKALARAETPNAMMEAAGAFYTQHRDFVLSVIPSSPILVDGFAVGRLAKLRAALTAKEWKPTAEALLATWESEGGASVKDLLLGVAHE